MPPEKPLLQAAAAERVAVAELVGRQQVANALDRDGRVEEPEPAAQHGLVALVEAPGEADARAEVVLVRVDERLGQARLGGRERAVQRDQAGRQLRRDLGVRHDVVAAVRRDEVGERVVLLVPRADDLVAQAEKHREALGSPSSRPGRRTAKSLEWPSSGPRLVTWSRTSLRQAEQEVRERVAGRRAAEPVPPAEVHAEAEPVARHVAGPEPAALDRVAARDPGEVVADREGVLIDAFGPRSVPASAMLVGRLRPAWNLN